MRRISRCFKNVFLYPIKEYGEVIFLLDKIKNKKRPIKNYEKCHKK
jgi:hypothetical protein